MTCESCGNARCEQMSGGGRMYPDSYFCCRCVAVGVPPVRWELCEGCSPEEVTA